MNTSVKLYLFPSFLFMSIQVFHHCFMPIFHLVDEILETIIHLTKYHSQLHGFIDLNQTNGLNV
jgi:hypothetical protein